MNLNLLILRHSEYAIHTNNTILQPALLYLVPFGIIVPVITSAATGHLSHLIAYVPYYTYQCDTDNAILFNFEEIILGFVFLYFIVLALISQKPQLRRVTRGSEGQKGRGQV